MIIHMLFGIAALLFIINTICHISTFQIRDFRFGDFIIVFIFSYVFFVFLGPLLRLGQNLPAFLRVVAMDAQRAVSQKTTAVESMHKKVRAGMEYQIMQQMQKAVSEITSSNGEKSLSNSWKSQ